MSLGGEQRILMVFTDLTELMRAREALAESEAKYRELVESANSIILRMDLAGNIVFMNEFGLKFFRYAREELLGRNVVGTIVPPMDSASRDLKLMIDDILKNPEKYAANENENMRRDEDRVWVSWTNKGIYDKEGRLTGLLCIETT